MTDITIPPEVEKAVARSMCDWDGFDCDEVQTKPDGTTYVMWESYIPKTRAACLAMLKAWPHMLINGPDEGLILQRARHHPPPALLKGDSDD